MPVNSTSPQAVSALISRHAGIALREPPLRLSVKNIAVRVKSSADVEKVEHVLTAHGYVYTIDLQRYPNTVFVKGRDSERLDHICRACHVARESKKPLSAKAVKFKRAMVEAQEEAARRQAMPLHPSMRGRKV